MEWYLGQITKSPFVNSLFATLQTGLNNRVSITQFAFWFVCENAFIAWLKQNVNNYQLIE